MDEALKRLAEDPSVIVIDLYPHPLGDKQMLWLDVQSPEALGQLRAVFVELAEGRAREVSLSSVGWAAFTSRICDVTLKRTDAREEPSRTVELRKGTPGASSIEWTRHAKGWLECVDLVEALAPDPVHHQYLNNGTEDEAEIQVSFRESGAEHRFWHLRE
ncbi:MAG TPA: hypothetical protein VN893_12485 [Bryobacteraceae bacterium]|nr:hypothetical protein [Bryobacteraceae bacterium]